jgi:aminoglycoside phosphotransferase (APT) family kinase protein
VQYLLAQAFEIDGRLSDVRRLNDSRRSRCETSLGELMEGAWIDFHVALLRWRGRVVREQQRTRMLDHQRLDDFLRGALGGLAGAMRIEPVAGGQSNPTYFITYDNRRLVLRKQPAEVLPSAHAVDREYRVLTALAVTDVPVPRTLLFCDDRSVVGTMFYVMERLDGRVFSDVALPAQTPAERAAMYASMVRTLAKLHAVDPAAVGLGDYGKPGNYYVRQITRWSKQWERSKTREVPDLDRLVRWLPANVPPGDETTIAHGDYRLGNLMFHPSEPHVIGVLDWELSTLGHPLADVAYNCIAWHMGPDDLSAARGLRGLDLPALGIPTEDQYVSTYCGFTGRPPIGTFHMAFAFFRSAVIFEGIAARAQAGHAVAADAAEVGRYGIVFARRAVELIDAA